MGNQARDGISETSLVVTVVISIIEGIKVRTIAAEQPRLGSSLSDFLKVEFHILHRICEFVGRDHLPSVPDLPIE